MSEFNAILPFRSFSSSPEGVEDVDQSDGESQIIPGDFATTTSLEVLQTAEQSRILDTVAQVRKCGLESILSLPQVCVCGDQSSGKSSVLEALTEIPFPRNDNLCTRFATEIILRRAPSNSLAIKIIPDNQRPLSEQATIKNFKRSITDFRELPTIMDSAMSIIGLTSKAKAKVSAFSRDVLSIEIAGPSRPQLALVDLPGLIANATKGVTEADVQMVADITDHYISNPRTIALSVISATNDHSNQSILTKVRKVDPAGTRTLGIITKPDRLSAGSGSEQAFISLAQNEDVFFKLGWHVLKNRAYEEGNSSLLERNAVEAAYFQRSNFKVLPKETVGIEALRTRLSHLLFDHVKKELPKLRQDLEDALADTKDQLALLGNPRSTPAECKAYLSRLSLAYHTVCKDAVKGHYEGEYFHKDIGRDGERSFKEAFTITESRLRARVQRLNTQFADRFRKEAHKYVFNLQSHTPVDPESDNTLPIPLCKTEVFDWIGQVLARTRGRELVGNYSPFLVGELFWEQSIKWQRHAVEHIEEMAQLCSEFLDTLLKTQCPADIQGQLWNFKIHEALKARRAAANGELARLMKDLVDFPINYNHYYTKTIEKRRHARSQSALKKSIEGSGNYGYPPGQEETGQQSLLSINIDKVIESYTAPQDSDMENFSCEDALDCLLAIYKVLQKTFIANITTQVIERWIVRGLEDIFSPIVVNDLSDAEVEAIAAEPAANRRQREFLTDRISKLEDGQQIFRGVMGSSAK